jgi:sugar lactone lactonase YvrE
MKPVISLKQYTTLCISLLCAIVIVSCSKSAQPDTPVPITATPTISSVDVTEGTFNATVVITGANFSATSSDDLVYFNAVQATVISATATQLTVTVPQNAGTGTITIKIKGVGATGPVFTYLQALTITSLDIVQGGFNTTITITGTGFSTIPSHDQVFFNNKAATVISATATQVVATVPVGAGTGAVTMKVVQSNATGPTFTYQLLAVVSTFAGNTFGSADGTGLAASFGYPNNMAIDATGNLYVADEFNGSVRKITPAGVVTTVAKGFNHPAGVAIDANGTIYVGDKGNNIIRKISTTGVVSILAGSGSAGAANGTGTNATFDTPLGMTTDASGNVYVSDGNNNLIRKITPAGVVTTFAGNGTIGAVNGNSTTASFNAPFGLAMDASGTMYVADTYNNLIRKISATGVVTTLAGSGAAGATNGTGTGASFNQPRGVAVDASGNVYVADFGNSGLIRKITSAGVVTTLAGGVSGFADGVGTAARFAGVYDVVVDATGIIYVTDGGNNSIRKIVIQ